MTNYNDTMVDVMAEQIMARQRVVLKRLRYKILVKDFIFRMRGITDITKRLSKDLDRYDEELEFLMIVEKGIELERLRLMRD